MGGEPKQFREIGGVPMLLRALRPFAQHPRVRQLVIALPTAFVSSPPAWLEPVASGRLRIVAGCATRAESVLAALNELEPDCRIVLIHDAARPFVSYETVDRVIESSKEAAAVPCVRVTDTLKRVHEDSYRVVETVSREGLWRAQTPQGFPRDLLEDAYQRIGADAISQFTDEAALCEAAGYPVQIVPDSDRNIKITNPDDFTVAEALVRT
ncbi:MAG: 2-C-methyl-D-erythritol 4-phosphate cytidylyltransferase [Gemmatimonadota bacterium]|nr:MAG: 2-C-methyl-D-erythritol 4-phosphate cytidylyltransferase [Gemmatimonadota bacterium]